MINPFTYNQGTIKIITINLQRTFYYRLTKIIEVWGNYHTQIIFYDKNNQIIYHRQGCFAHAIEVNISIEFVKWSDAGNHAFFYEFKRGKVPGDGIYQYVLIDLLNRVAYRIELYKYDHTFLDNLQNGFNAIEIIKEIEGLGIEKEKCITDEIIITTLNWLTGIDKWKPKVKLRNP